jgi:hypothetical protein
MRLFREESGFTLTELLVTMVSATAIFMAITMMITTALRNQDRISRRVDAGSRVRPVLTHVVQELHSACVAQHVVPVIANGTASGQNASTGTQISFLSKSGNAVTPVPEQHVISLSGTTLTESVYQATGGSQPGPWTFSTTPSSTTTLLTQVSAPTGGMFQYFDFVNGSLDTTPSTVPLSATDASRTSVIKVTMSSAPGRGTRTTSSWDPNSALVVSDSVDLRLENAGQYPNQDNLPCV